MLNIILFNLELVVELVSGGDSGVTGKLFLEQGFGYVHIRGEIHGLKPGPHGFHIHMDGNLDDNCKAAGGHFNPDQVISRQSAKVKMMR